MNFDQDTVLTAYLDNELPPDLREGVASAVASDPRLADDLRALRAVGELIAALPRPPASVDVSAAVLTGIGLRSLWRERWDVLARLPAASSAPLRAVGLVASAAAVVAALTFAFARPGPRPARPTVVHRTTPPAPVASPVSTPGVVARRQTSADDAGNAVEGGRQDDAHRHVRRLLDSPELHKVFVVTDVLGGQADRQIGEILEKSPRKHSPFGRITVAQGIVIDPTLPGKAIVYVVVMDDRELGDLRDKLNRVFPANLQENPPRADVVSRLADVGQVALLPGTPVSDLLEDRVLERQRATPEFSEPTPPPNSMVGVPPGADSDPLLDPRRIQNVTTDEADAAEPSIERFRSGPHPSVSARAHSEKVAQSRPIPSKVPTPLPSVPFVRPPARHTHVVIVWVASPASSEGL